MTPQPPKMPKPPKMPQSPIDVAPIGSRPDATATAYKSLVSSSPVGERKPAAVAKKSLIGGAK